MEYSEALKKVRAEKPKDNFMVVRIENGYSSRLVLPHKDAITLLSALANAEVIKEDYNEPTRINGLDRDMVRMTTMSRDEYELIKMAALLNISVDEMKKLAEAQPK